MTQSNANLKTFIQDTYSQAQNRIQDTYTQAQDRIIKLADRAQNSLRESSAKVEELTNIPQLKELLENLKNIEALKPGYLKDLGSEYGLVTKSELASVKDELKALKKEISALKGAIKKQAKPTRAELQKLQGEFASVAPVPRKRPTTKRTAAKATAKSSPKKKTTTKAKATKKATAKK